jgi:hypothetical protein
MHHSSQCYVTHVNGKTFDLFVTILHVNSLSPTHNMWFCVIQSTFISYPISLSTLDNPPVANRLLKQMLEPSSLPSSLCQGSHTENPSQWQPMNFIVCTLCARFEATHYAQNRLNSDKENFANILRGYKQKGLFNKQHDRCASNEIYTFTYIPTFRRASIYCRSPQGVLHQTSIYMKHRVFIKYQISVDKQTKYHFRNV